MMKLNDKEIQKIKFDALVERRLREIQTVANLEAELKYWEGQRKFLAVKSPENTASIQIYKIKKEVEVHKEMINVLDEMIEELEKI